jgi:hypothetical protein
MAEPAVATAASRARSFGFNAFYCGALAATEWQPVGRHHRTLCHVIAGIITAY